MSEPREKENEKPLYNIDDRGYNLQAWYLKNTEATEGNAISAHALFEIRYNGEIIKQALYPAYKIYNIAAHFVDIVDSELSKDDKERGFKMAGSTGFGGCIMPVEVKNDIHA